MNIAQIKKDKSLLFECVSGSKAYGLSHKDSDTDLRGVFIVPKMQFYGLNIMDQVSDATNDEVYYELKKFIGLLAKNNPNFLEMLLTPEDCILYKHPFFDAIQAKDFISKLCQQTFAGYAMSQIKKARGLNKKIVNPMSKMRKSVLDFCYIAFGQGSISLHKFLKIKGIKHENCGLVNIANMKGMYALFHSKTQNYVGITKSDRANDIALSSIPKGEEPIGTLYFNKDGYSVYCKEYRQYWAWVEKRNESRYQNTVEYGKNYDSKNMMHTFRLLHIAEEIARTGTFQVRRTSDLDFLWQVRKGGFMYEDLVQRAKEKVIEIEGLFKKADLQEKPDIEKVEALLVELRDRFYRD